ncbi:MAG: hypothetical protein QME75_14640 [Deltaproteobacteria bacterium]|nr:hypothetical protein [Desulfitobacteriaceae bacterium]MDI6854827.1 hypothetical protein [Deltaproteobacteria bacterium]
MYQDDQNRDSAPAVDQDIAVMLEIQGEAAQGSMRLPVRIRGAEHGQVMLLLGQLMPEFMRESLVNLKANLYLAVPDVQEIVEASGKVAWLKISGSGRTQTLALELTESHPEFLALLRKQIVNSPADIKELWERWDQVKDNDVRASGEPINYHIGLGFMASGIILNLIGPSNSFFFLATYLLMFLGGLIAGVKNLVPIRWRRFKQEW